MSSTMLCSLTAEKIVWSIRVRAQAVWKGINRRTNDFKGFNIVFIDEQDSRIHAFISEKLSDGFAEDLKEGQVYTLSNFKVHKYKGDENNRVVRNEMHIYFENQTKLKKIDTDVPLIKKYAFDPFGLQDIPKFVNDNRFLIDVVGICDKSTGTCLISTDEPRKSRFKFRLSDGRNEVVVTFFNELGKDFEIALKEHNEDKVSVVIASSKVNKYEATGEIYLTNYPATRFYINPNHYSVRKLLKSFAFNRESVQPNSTIYSVKQIKQFGVEYIEKNISCHVTVKKVDDQCTWYDNWHIKCDKEVTIVDGRYRCTNCKRNFPYPDKRFRICTLCSDDSGMLPIIFPDEEIQRIIGKDVYDLENENRERFYHYLSISKEIILKERTVYTAKKLTDPVEMLGNHIPVYPLSPNIEELSMNTVTDPIVNQMSYISPPTAKSSNRTRGRKNKVSVKMELDDNERNAKLKKS
ncbi:hypothetical protein POM88_006526 [Heracleum sosnowskyi]|uniref:Uncharacterized protein n=1 Tax=Heracleum sosnowskyi TaxID=360622 RepID=A0AAD8N6J1_9APIA|nr:hypothetical protein POM88_006526 [Heracleum sosnowskyi]